MFENARRGRQARNFTTNVPKILVLKSSSEQIFSRKLPLGAPVDSHPEQKCLVTYHTLASVYVCVWLVNTLASTAPGSIYRARRIQ